MNESELRKRVIRLAHENPNMRKDLLAVLKNADCGNLPEALQENCENKVQEGKENKKTEKEASEDRMIIQRAISTINDYIGDVHDVVMAAHKRGSDKDQWVISGPDLSMCLKKISSIRSLL